MKIGRLINLAETPETYDIGFKPSHKIELINPTPELQIKSTTE